jgi:hypothetical protein
MCNLPESDPDPCCSASVALLLLHVLKSYLFQPKLLMKQYTLKSDILKGHN